MVNKKKNKIKYIERYALILLVSGYILGICIGAFFVFSNIDAQITNIVYNKSSFKLLSFFFFALILKYSGILSGAICGLPIFLGIFNSAYYCYNILNGNNKLIYTTIITMLKDTAICLLLILYIIVIIVQISSQKYSFRKDIKYFSVYIGGAVIINILENIFITFIF